MTLKELADRAARLIAQGHGDLTVYAVASSSGVSYELAGGRTRVKDSGDDAGPICDLEDGTMIAVFSLD